MLPFSGVGAAGQVHTHSMGLISAGPLGHWAWQISPGPLLGLVLRKHNGYGKDSRQR